MIGIGLEDGLESAPITADLLERGAIVNAPEPQTPAAAAAADDRSEPRSSAPLR